MKGNFRRFIGRLESCITPWKIFYGVTFNKKVTEQYFPVVILITKVKQRRRRRQRKWQKGPQ